MNTIEFAVQDGVPYAIDFLNPAPDFERDRITPHYFDLVLEKMTKLVIDRALSGQASQSWPRWAEMTGLAARRVTPVGLWTCEIEIATSDPIASVARSWSSPSSGRTICCAARWRRRCASGGSRSADACSARSCGRSFSIAGRRAARQARRRNAVAAGRARGGRAARRRPALLRELGLSDAEIALARHRSRLRVASTAARADAFILPDSLQFAEYNAESPAGPGYSQRLAELFDEGAADGAISRALRRALLHADRAPARGAARRATATGAARRRRRDRDRRLARRCRPGASSSCCATRSRRPACRRSIADPRDLVFDGRALTAERRADRSRLPPRAHQRHRGASGRVPRPGGRLPRRARLRRQQPALQDPAQEGVLRRPDRRSLRRTCSRPTSATSSRRTCRGRASCRGRTRAALDRPRRAGAATQLVLKPNDEYGGTGVTLGWETDERVGRRRSSARLARIRARLDRAGADSPSGAKRSRSASDGGVAERDMLVDFAPYLFRGRVAGFLTRLSATGLANVTSGGGQVPAFIVAARKAACMMTRRPFSDRSRRSSRRARAMPSKSAWRSSPASAWRSSPTRPAAKSRPAWRPRWKPRGRRGRRVADRGACASRPLADAPPGDPRRARALRRRHPVRAAATGRAAAPAWRSSRTVERRQIRYAHMVGVTPEIMMQGMRADYRLVDRLSTTLCERMRTARRCASKRPFGTSLTRDVRSGAALGQDQRPDQHALLVEPARRRSVHDAGLGGRRVRLQRDRG